MQANGYYKIIRSVASVLKETNFFENDGSGFVYVSPSTYFPDTVVQLVSLVSKSAWSVDHAGSMKNGTKKINEKRENIVWK